MIEQIESIRSEALVAIRGAASSSELEALRVRFLGRKARLPLLLREVRMLSDAERGKVGRAANEARAQIEAEIEARAHALRVSELDERLARERDDLTLPGDPPLAVGAAHVISALTRELEDIFIGLGYSVLEGPEIETVHYNFDALNHSPTHPARDESDTFYIDAETHGGEGARLLLRTHTSPMQIRAMEAHPPPLFVVIPGRVYRPDSDATHTPQFHQLEGLAVGEGITLADLKGTLLAFARAVFGSEREVRLRPHFFPFTEPSVEVDVSCFACSGRGDLADGSRCALCKGEGWLEVLGAGEVDPNVFAAVPDTAANTPGYDPERVQGFAWGMGIERIAMLRYGIPDLRLYFENDVRFLEQLR
ncbi:MAG TPA: phenylalanine--tRNA ligase subunit alpha [Solirubrobacteraceae bacterium]|nr:phenylalanine--tRNA ligase subunit alpha [Solirubrobacteraceae bacterium]